MRALEVCYKRINDARTPKYVKKQMELFIEIAEGRHDKYIISPKKLKQMEGLLKILIMPKGLKAGKTLYECTTEYQWLFYTATLCTVYRDNPERRRYETNILEICRKNFKTFACAFCFIFLMITEPKFSEFYSVAPDGSLSREIKSAIDKTLKSSPLIFKDPAGRERWKILRDNVTFKLTETKYTPLNYSTSDMDGKMPNVFIADEVGALPISYPIEAMRSGQLNMLNKMGFIISTKYPTINNPFEDEVAYSKKVLDGVIEDETVFALLYEPDNTENWESDDLILQQANPVSLEIPEIWDDLIKKRAQAIEVESKRENFVTKHCNIIYQGAGTETYIDTKDVQECRVENIDWNGRIVYVGVDLSESNDNTSVSLVSVDNNDNLLIDSYAFIPEGRVDEKSTYEKVNYRELEKTGKVIGCGDKVIDYGAVEEFVLSLEERLGVKIQAIGYDRWNALSSAQKFESAGYNTVEIRQHSSVLHPPTKLLKEKILSREAMYTNNKLLEINFQNARCVEDTNKNKYVNKKKSKGKVDMVVSLINALYLCQQDYYLNQADDFIIQVI